MCHSLDLPTGLKFWIIRVAYGVYTRWLELCKFLSATGTCGVLQRGTPPPRDCEVATAHSTQHVHTAPDI